MNRSYAKLMEQADDQTPPPIVRIVESLLFAAEVPLDAKQAGEIIRGLTAEEFHAAIDQLTKLYRRQERPYAVQSSPAGYRLALKPTYRSLRERMFGGPREARLSVPTLDVLSLVAYRQPIARTAIDALRGLDSASQLRQLVRLGLIAVVPQDGARSEAQYVTAGRFLELFGLKDLDDLPVIQDMLDVT